MNHPRVFISYSQESDEHSNRVLSLSQSLREDGFDCRIDQYEVDPPSGWARWMTAQTKEAEFIVVICTEKYLDRFEGTEPLGIGRGVRFESALLMNQFARDSSLNKKCIPVFFEANQESHIPRIFGGTFFWIKPAILESSKRYEDPDYVSLLNRLHNRARAVPTQLGQRKILADGERPSREPMPRLERKEDFFTPAKSDLDEGNGKRRIESVDHATRQREKLKSRGKDTIVLIAALLLMGLVIIGIAKMIGHRNRNPTEETANTKPASPVSTSESLEFCLVRSFSKLSVDAVGSNRFDRLEGWQSDASLFAGKVTLVQKSGEEIEWQRLFTLQPLKELPFLMEWPERRESQILGQAMYKTMIGVKSNSDSVVIRVSCSPGVLASFVVWIGASEPSSLVREVNWDDISHAESAMSSKEGVLRHVNLQGGHEFIEQAKEVIPPTVLPIARIKNGVPSSLNAYVWVRFRINLNDLGKWITAWGRAKEEQWKRDLRTRSRLAPYLERGSLSDSQILEAFVLPGGQPSLSDDGFSSITVFSEK
jgi:hypothetical protein